MKPWHDKLYKDGKGVLHRRNGSWCDTDDGPCSCGAWHAVEEIPPEALLDPIREINRLQNFLNKATVSIKNENIKFRKDNIAGLFATCNLSSVKFGGENKTRIKRNMKNNLQKMFGCKIDFKS